MKITFYISVAAAGLSLILSVVLFTVGAGNQSLQTEVQKQQQELQKQQDQINTGNSISQKVGPELLRDMAISSIKDENMKLLLAKHGYNVPSKNTPAPSSAPASPPLPLRPPLPPRFAPDFSPPMKPESDFSYSEPPVETRTLLRSPHCICRSPCFAARWR